MGRKTKISWCSHTWSPWRGCTHATLQDGTAHPGCVHCFAEALSKRNQKVLGTWGPDGARVVNANWKTVLRWNAEAAMDSVRRSVFPSLCDPFEEFDGWIMRPNGDVMIDDDQTPGGEAWSLATVRREFFRLIDATPHLDYLLLTKRPQNVWKKWEPTDRKPLPDRPVSLHERPHPLHRQNVYLGVSVSDQRTADELIPELLKLRDLSPVLFVSIEPLLGPVNLTRLCEERGLACPGVDGLDWVIIGGESGPHARPCELEWIRSIVQQCRNAQVPCYVKQLGSHAISTSWCVPNAVPIRIKTRDAKGADPAEWPVDLRVQQHVASKE